MKLVLTTSKICGPCFSLNKRLGREKLEVETKEYSEDTDFFQKHQIRFVPRLLVFDGDEIVEEIQGSDDIIDRIKAESIKD